jgi:hypothetical protein
VEHYANAARVDPGVCWRFVSRGDGYRKGSPTGCPEPVAWMGRTMIGPTRYRVYSCDGHLDEVEDVRPVRVVGPGAWPPAGPDIRPSTGGRPTLRGLR